MFQYSFQKVEWTYRKMNNKQQFENSSQFTNPSKRWVRHMLATTAALALFCVTAVAVQASELAGGDPSPSGFQWSVSNLVSILWIPLVVLVLFSLIVNKRQGWGWVVTGILIVIALAFLQLLWSIITSFRGDPGDDEDYFKPLDNWTSDSF